MDFFHYLIPPFCISPHLKLLHIFFLYYISAFYPLCLIGITWTCIQLHSRNFKPLTRLWDIIMTRYSCLTKWITASSSSKSTIIDVFATFFLLSYTKLLYRVSYRLSAARYSRTCYLSGGTTYHAPSCVATGPAPVITGAATFSP